VLPSAVCRSPEQGARLVPYAGDVPRLVVLLRGVNLVSRNRVSMPELRRALEGAGFERVETYLQSGNVVLATDLRPQALAGVVAGVVSERFGVDNGVVVRTHRELAEVVARNPLSSVAVDPKRYQVTFLDGEADPSVLDQLEATAARDERLVHVGREIFTWHPAGAGRSRLARLLSSRRLCVTATTRNWTTVSALLALAAKQ
jgi:uncharacterized protein (DUF1697 family)